MPTRRNGDSNSRTSSNSRSNNSSNRWPRPPRQGALCIWGLQPSPTASVCKASLLPFSSTAATPNALLPPPAAAMEGGAATAGAAAAARSSGVEAVASFNTLATGAACLDAEEQHIKANGASFGTISQGGLGTIRATPIASSPKGGMLKGSAVYYRDGEATSVAVAAGVSAGDNGGVGRLADAAPVVSRRGEAVNTTVPVTFGVKPEPSVYPLAEALEARVQLGKAIAVPPSAAAARGPAATTVAIEAAGTLPPSPAQLPPPAATAAATLTTPLAAPPAANSNADAALPAASARAILAPASATANAAPPAALAAALPATTAAADPRPAQAAAACDVHCCIGLPANKRGPPGAGSKRQLLLNHVAQAKAVKKEYHSQQGDLQAVQLPAAPAAAAAEHMRTAEHLRTAGAAGTRTRTGMEQRKVPTAAAPTGAGTMALREHWVFTGEAAGTEDARHCDIENHCRAKGTLSKNSSGDAAGNRLGGDGGKGYGGLHLRKPGDTASETKLASAVPNAVHKGSSGEGVWERHVG